MSASSSAGSTQGALRMSMAGTFDYGHGRIEKHSAFHIFSGNDVNAPTPDKADCRAGDRLIRGDDLVDLSKSKILIYPRPAIWDMAKDMIEEAGEYAQSKGLEIVLELEPFNEALLKDVHELARFVKEIDHPAVRANADISHLHLSDCTFEEVAELKGLIGHIHLSDCDGKVHGDMPAGMGVTPIKEYLAAIRDTGYDGTVSIELEYAPNPDEIVAWAQKAYDGTAAIMAELGVRG